MPNFSISNLVMNHPIIFKGIKFNLTWATDEEMRRLMYAYYVTQDMAFPDEDLMTMKIQLKADLIMEAKLTIVHMRIKNILCIMMLLFMYIKAKLDFLDMKKEKR